MLVIVCLYINSHIVLLIGGNNFLTFHQSILHINIRYVITLNWVYTVRVSSCLTFHVRIICFLFTLDLCLSFLVFNCYYYWKIEWLTAMVKYFLSQNLFSPLRFSLKRLIWFVYCLLLFRFWNSFKHLLPRCAASSNDNGNDYRS